MRLLLLVVIIAFAALAANPQNVVPIAEKTGTIEGFVRKEGTTEPVEDAVVTLIKRFDYSFNPASARTDRQGRFTFRDLPPAGNYTVFVEREGYYSPSVAKRPWTKSVPVVAGQHVVGVLLELIPLGVISGRVLGPDGEPLVGRTVVAGREYYGDDGKRGLSLSGGNGATGDVQFRQEAVTNDLGEYRIFWLIPGEYYVGTPRQAHDLLPMLPQSWFPGTLDQSSARPVTVRPGAELAGINFRIPSRDVPVFSVSGVVVAPPSVNLKPIEGFRLVRSGSNTSEGWYRNVASDQSQGRFQIRGIPSGAYDAYVKVMDDGNRTYLARIPVETRDLDINNLRIVVQPGLEIRGRFVWSGSAPADPRWYPDITLASKDDGVNYQFMSNTANPNAPSRPLVDAATGTFTYQGLLPGRYTFRYSASGRVGSPNAYIVDLRQAGSSVLNEGFTVRDNSADPLEVVVSASVGTLEIAVVDATQSPAEGTMVVLAPNALRRRTQDLYFSGRAREDGRLIMRDIPPGEYRAFAWSEDVPGNAWRNAEFMAPYEQRGVPVRVDPNVSISIRVTTIPKPKL